AASAAQQRSVRGTGCLLASEGKKDPTGRSGAEPGTTRPPAGPGAPGTVATVADVAAAGKRRSSRRRTGQGPDSLPPRPYHSPLTRAPVPPLSDFPRQAAFPASACPTTNLSLVSRPPAHVADAAARRGTGPGGEARRGMSESHGAEKDLPVPPVRETTHACP